MMGIQIVIVLVIPFVMAAGYPGWIVGQYAWLKFKLKITGCLAVWVFSYAYLNYMVFRH